MRENPEAYKKIIFTGIIVIALGVIFSTVLKESAGALGTVFIAIGCLLFLIGMSRKRKNDE